jgi:hypothetical protein
LAIFVGFSAAMGLFGSAGCSEDFIKEFFDGLEDVIDEVDDIEFEFFSRVDRLQTRRPVDDDLPDVIIQRGDTIIIDNSVTIINNISTDVVIEELPNELLIAFENLTGYDVYLKYLADGLEQGVLVYDGETLLLEYPCLEIISLISEDDIDRDSQLLVQSFDLDGISYFLGEDFGCGDVLILTFTPDEIISDIDLIEVFD